MSHPGPHGHAPPPPGEKQPGTGAPTQTAGFINVQGRLFAPLQGLNPADVLQGGYGFLDLTDGGHTYHPGADLNSGGSCNADEGLPVVAPLAGTVRKLLYWDGRSSGEGNHLWLELLDDVAPGPTWLHVDHLQAFAVGEGQRVIPGAVVGYCGRSGTWDCADLHLELLPAAPAQGYWQWPYGWSPAQVEAAYYRPRAWWDAAVARVGQAPPEIVSMILSGAQAAAVQAVVWGDYWRPEEADFAIQTSWRDEWRRGVWRGAPLSEEQLVPEDPAEGKPAGAWRLFQHGACAWLPVAGVSWNG